MEQGEIKVLATAICQNKKKEILLLKRSRNNHSYVGFWQLPEGKMEFGETPKQTLSRELKEEIGCQLTLGRPSDVQTIQITVKGKQYHVVRIVFKVRFKGDINLSEDHSHSGWFTPQEAIRKQKLLPGTREIIL